MLCDDLNYLNTALGIDAEAEDWTESNSLPLYLKSGVELSILHACGISFVLAQPSQDVSLPNLKRLHAQLARRADCPVAVSAPTADARQRRALVAQGIPFVCEGKQVSLPFLGVASTEWGKGRLEKKLHQKLSPKAQQTAIWGALKGSSYRLIDLREATGMSASQASDAVRELAQRGLAARSKNGREVIVMPLNVDMLLDDHLGNLTSPVLKTMFVCRCEQTEKLPDAGETALSHRSALIPPAIAQKAVSREAWKSLQDLEVLEGELPDDDLLQVQIWKYGPLTVGADAVDSISLALSLADTNDERVEDEVDSLFGKEYPWRKAR